jgi:DNA-binding NtrC family response regulator
VRYNKKEIKGVSPESEKIMLSYKWPGNVRELKNVVERIVVLENTELIQPEHLPNWFAETSTVTYRSSENNNRFILPESGISLDELEKDLMVQALERTNYNRTSAAKLLKVSYDTFRYQMKKLGVK